MTGESSRTRRNSCKGTESLIATHVATTDETGWYRLARREFIGETWGMDVRAGATLRRNAELCPVSAACDYIVVPGLRIHPTDSLVARGVDAVLPAACPDSPRR
ncbi:MAG: hypothetical protein ACXWLF_06150 [Myxococcaceae bacterium]